MKKLVANTVRMRQINRELILDALKGTDGLKTTQLAQMTDLSLATCANIINVLLGSGDVIAQESKTTNGGRPARVFLLNPNQANTACLLVKSRGNQTDLIYTVNNANGDAISKGEKSVQDLTMDDIDSLLSMITKDFTITALAIAIPGVVTAGLITECEIPSLIGIPLEARIQKRHAVEVIVDNDVNFAAIGYHRNNPDISSAGLVFLTFSSLHCPGCGLVLNNHLVKGRDNFAGEIAPIISLLKPLSAASKKEPEIVQLAGNITAIVSALVNPAAVVIAGDDIFPEMLESIERVCKKTIAERHIPRIIVKTDYKKECFDGMQSAASNHLSCSYKLLELDKQWCGSNIG